MIDFQIYKIMHILGLTIMLMGLAGVLFAFALNSVVPPKVRMMTFAFHGTGLLLMLVGGFGMLARLGLVNGLPLWIYAKLAIWLIFSGATVLAKRKLLPPGLFIVLAAALVGIATYLALYKPF